MFQKLKKFCVFTTKPLLNDLERESFKITPINNPHYQPLKGA